MLSTTLSSGLNLHVCSCSWVAEKHAAVNLNGVFSPSRPLPRNSSSTNRDDRRWRSVPWGTSLYKTLTTNCMFGCPSWLLVQTKKNFFVNKLTLSDLQFCQLCAWKTWLFSVCSLSKEILLLLVQLTQKIASGGKKMPQICCEMIHDEPLEHSALN